MILSKNICIYKKEGKFLTYFNHINHIFLIWAGKNNELDQFYKDLNEKHPPIKFDSKALKSCSGFLDAGIYLHNGRLHTDIQKRKLIDKNTFT